MKCSPGCMAAASRAAKSIPLMILLLLAFAALPQARAATFCIAAGDFVGLQSALAVASNNNEDDLIQLQAGQYSMPQNFALNYEATTEHHDLTIEGGYGDNFGNPCGTPPAVADARATELVGGLLHLHFSFDVGSLTLESVTVKSTFSTDPLNPPIEISGYSNWTGDVTIRNSIFFGNGSTTTSAVYIFAAEGALSIQNSVFADNVSFSGVSPVHLGSLRTGGTCTLIANSTFTANTSLAAAVDVATPACLAIVANDIFWGNTGGDVFFDNPPSTYLFNDDLGDLAESANTQASGLLSVNPLFNPDFSLRDLSPLRDKGAIGGFFAVGLFDVIGNPRVYGANPDIGAYEIQDVIFADGFEVE